MKTYGTVEFIPKHPQTWVVECEPHVSLRLKRVFAKLGKGSQGKHVFSHNPEFARELIWFMQRYPLAMKPLERSFLENQAKKHEDRQTLVEQLVKGMIKPRRFDMAVPARDYQRVAAELTLSSGGLLLTDDVGLGKTATAITMLTDARTRPALVITLTHLPKQWVSEIQKFAPQLTYHIIKSSTPYDLTAVRNGRNNGNGNDRQSLLGGSVPDVIVINYHKLHGWAETLSGICRSVIFDEIQELRSGDKVAKYQAARLIAYEASFRLGLSATPIYNYGGEFYNVLDCVKPGALGTRSEFVEEWCTSGENNKPAIKNPKAFGSYLLDNGYMLRRTRQDVGRELPDLIKIPHYVDTDMNALNSVSRSCAELARLILKQGEDHKGEKMQASEELGNKLRQATGIAKAPYVAEFVRLLVEQGEKVVVFAWHREVWNILLDRLKEFKPAMYTGTERTPAIKDENKRRFIEGETPLFFISLRAGAGVDGLQNVSRTVVNAELDWSDSVHQQNIGRVHRDGQLDVVTAYFLISETGSDPVVADVLGIKKYQMEGVRDPNLNLVEKLQVDTKDRMKRLAESYLAQLHKRN